MLVLASSRRCARIIALFCATSACTDFTSHEPSQLESVIDADVQTREATVEVRASLEERDPNGSGWLPRGERRFTPGGPGDWPLTFRTRFAGELRGVYQLTATARDARDAVIAQARVIQRFQHAASSEQVRVRFEDGCLMRSQLCGQGQTCRGGACVSANDDSDSASVTRSQASEPNADAGMPRGADPSIDRSKPIPECEGKGADHAYCAGDTLRVCSDPFAPKSIPCGEHELCVPDGASVRCACAIGFVEREGGCEKASVCGSDNGGCDPLTKCEIVSGSIVCGACPAGYRGTDSSGCAPLLTGLAVEPGTLEPAFDPRGMRYTVRAPLVAVQLALTATAPEKTSISADGRKLDSGASWRTPGLPLGQSRLNLELTSSSGARSTYELSIDRTAGEMTYVKAESPGSASLFGFAVAVDRDTLVVGAPVEAASGGSFSSSASGAAYVFVREAGRWTQRARLTAATPVSNEHFGASVALLGDTLAIGACANDPIDRPTSATTPGAVYLFTRNGQEWAQTARLTAPDASGGDLFGFQLHLTSEVLFVGAPYESSQATRSGAVYAFDRANPSAMPAKLKPARPSAEAAFGSSIASDAATVVVGAFSDSSAADRGGAAYVFERDNRGWVESQRLEPAKPVAGATFGWSAAVSGNWVVVGAPRWGHWRSTPSGEAYVYRRGVDGWSQSAVLEAPIPRESDYFGDAMLLTPSRLVLAANGDSSGNGGVGAAGRDSSQPYSGAVYFYSLEGDALVPNVVLKAARPLSGDGFGVSLALSGDTLAIGAAFDDKGAGGVDPEASSDGRSDSGAVHVFR